MTLTPLSTLNTTLTPLSTLNTTLTRLSTLNTTLTPLSTLSTTPTPLSALSTTLTPLSTLSTTLTPLSTLSTTLTSLSTLSTTLTPLSALSTTPTPLSTLSTNFATLSNPGNNKRLCCHTYRRDGCSSHAPSICNHGNMVSSGPAVTSYTSCSTATVSRPASVTTARRSATLGSPWDTRSGSMPSSAVRTRRRCIPVWVVLVLR